MPRKTHDDDVEFIRALADLLNQHDLTELQVRRDYGENDSLKVRVSRRQEVAPQPLALPAAVAAGAPAAVAAMAQPGAPAADSGNGPVADTVEDLARHPGAVISPMVGTVYMQAEPGAPPFVAVGAQVAEGDTVLIIEAMKTMNHIPAPHSGTVRRILVEDGAAVEYGSPLMIIE